MRDPQLPLFEAAPEDPNVQWLEQLLKDCASWQAAREILQLAGKPNTDDGRRWVRALAQASQWVISGQRGYKHLHNATAEEAGHFVNWMESQAKKMTRRAEKLRRNAHVVFG